MSDFEAAKREYEKFYPNSPFFETWIPREKFLGAEVDGKGSISISREDDGIYGIAIGPAPVIASGWKDFSIESCAIDSLPEYFKAGVQWDCH
jgi:hypothetical protein